MDFKWSQMKMYEIAARLLMLFIYKDLNKVMLFPFRIDLEIDKTLFKYASHFNWSWFPSGATFKL